MKLMDAIKGRRSIRKYKPDPVPKELIEKSLEAGIWAPSAKNGQPWRFTVLTGEAKEKFTTFFRRELNKFVEIHGREEAGSSLGSCSIMEEAPVLILVWNAGKYGWTTEEHSVAAAIQNVLIRAYELGLGSLWYGDIYYAHDAIVEYFSKPWKLSGAISLGYSDMEGRVPPRRHYDELVEFLE